MKIQIKNHYNDSIIFEGEFESLLQAVEEAVRKNVCLDGASLNHASLDRASLNHASLNGASLDRANLNHASLIDASLNGARLNGARLNGASLNHAKGLNKYSTTSLYGMFDQSGPIRSYKLIQQNGTGPYAATSGGTPILYEIGQQYEVKDADTDEYKSCGAGINLATLDWCVREWREGYRILIVEHTATDIAAIPIGSDGKYRVFRCKVIGEKNLEQLGLMPQEICP